jgi:hypothetical protein
VAGKVPFCTHSVISFSVFFRRQKLHIIFTLSECFKNTHTHTFPSSDTYQRVARTRASHDYTTDTNITDTTQIVTDEYRHFPVTCKKENDSVSERIIQLHTEIGRNTLYRHSSMFQSSQRYTHEAHKRAYVGNYVSYLFAEGHTVVPLVEALRYKPGSIPDGVTGIFHSYIPYGHINGPGVD